MDRIILRALVTIGTAYNSNPGVETTVMPCNEAAGFIRGYVLAPGEADYEALESFAGWLSDPLRRVGDYMTISNDEGEDVATVVIVIDPAFLQTIEG